jgi:hypothetical protein
MTTIVIAACAAALCGRHQGGDERCGANFTIFVDQTVLTRLQFTLRHFYFLSPKRPVSNAFETNRSPVTPKQSMLTIL